ncbi:MAG TPA: LysM peptidoglycan-binding domain-containing protein [Gammaproteobacteria bacterium]
MLHARVPFVRSAQLVAAFAVGLAVAHVASGQSRDATRLAAAPAVGQTQSSPVLNPRHPERYVVQPGDTLWDIAAMFLRDPWYWPEIWQINQQIENPHLIFPGDILSLAYLDDGRPVIQLERGPTAAGLVERLSPRVRSEPLEEAIPTIPYETLRAFLSRPVVLPEDDLDGLPYIVAQREGLMGSDGRDVYTRAYREELAEGAMYHVVRAGEKLVDPDTKDVLGYQGIYIGQGRVRRSGDPSTLTLIDTEREALVGDYLVEEDSVEPVNFLPRAPETDVDGSIISVIDGVSLIGQYQVVILNRGSAHGLEPGHVLRAYKRGRVVRDDVGRGVFREKVRLPDEPAGTMMVFRTFDRLSYALVMEANSALAVLDSVRNP